MKITQDVRDYAASQEAEKAAEAREAEQGMLEKSREFKAQGAEIYKKI